MSSKDQETGAALWINLDHGRHGIGSQSCGPGVRPPYRLHPRPAAFSFVFTDIGRPGGAPEAASRTGGSRRRSHPQRSEHSGSS
ncbi:hypothetical protein AB0D38_31025 [Streptomyces sp. NPDC048279]|uniref:hypothetical protein n=1 Tax=Streptomyces sp. NPDC048279 TaxID=3154714 RepID=UPI0034341F44